MENIIFKITNVPFNYYFSPKFIFNWWDLTIKEYGLEFAINHKNDEFKKAREMWIGSIFACCMRYHTNIEHWVTPINDSGSPDVEIGHYEGDKFGKQNLEITEYESHVINIYDILEKKLKRKYAKYTIILVYITKN